MIEESLSSEILASKVCNKKSLLYHDHNSPTTTLLCDHEMMYVLIIV